MKKPVRIINLTGHDIVVSVDGSELTYPRSSDPLRLVHRVETLCSDYNGVSIVRSVFIHNDDAMPMVKKGVMYLVPKLVAELYADIRDDFVSPGTNVLLDEPEFLYAEDGSRRVKAVKQFRLPGKLEI